MYAGRAEAAAGVDARRSSGARSGPAVPRDGGAGAVIRLADQVAEPLQRGVAVADRVVGRLAMGAVGFPGPVLEGQLALQAGGHLPHGVVVDRRTRRDPAVVGVGDQPGRPLGGGRAKQLVVEQIGQLGRNRMLGARLARSDVAGRGRIVGRLVVRQGHAPAADERRREQVRRRMGADEGAPHVGGQVVGDVVVGRAIERPAAERRGDEVVVGLVGLDALRDRAGGRHEVLVGHRPTIDGAGEVDGARIGARVAERASRQGPVVVHPEEAEVRPRRR